jgi:hypothetical protein
MPGALPNSNHFVSPIEAFTRLDSLANRATFSTPLITAEQPFMQQFMLLDEFDPMVDARPVLDEVPPQTSEAFGLILDDMQRISTSGSYVLRALFRQGDPTLSDDTDFDEWHRDFEGQCTVTYCVADSDPTLVRLDDKTTAADPYEVARLRGDIWHRQPSSVAPDRTIAVANLIPAEAFHGFGGGFIAKQMRATGRLKPARYH